LNWVIKESLREECVPAASQIHGQAASVRGSECRFGVFEADEFDGRLVAERRQ
jgi:hypothetical protein